MMVHQRSLHTLFYVTLPAVLSIPLVLGVSPMFGQSKPTSEAAETLPAGVEQMLPRGGIPAVFEPVFVSAEEAEISDDAWVLGVEMEGVARAYSLNLLNRHEIVNDRIGDKAFAAVW